MRVFVDTNLWAYPFDHRDSKKRQYASTWLRQVASVHDVVVSTQVMIELRSVLTRKLRPAIDAADVQIALAALAAFDVVATNANLVLDADVLAASEQLSWFDALIAEAAIRGHCDILYSEDFSHGQKLGGRLQVQNPFRD